MEELPNDAPEPEWMEPPSKCLILGKKVVVRDLTRALGLRTFDLVGELMRMGHFVTLGHTIDFETARALCRTYGVEACPRAAVDERIRERYPELPPALPGKVVLPPRVPVALLGRKLGLDEANVLPFLAHLGLEVSMDEVLEFGLAHTICRYLG